MTPSIARWASAASMGTSLMLPRSRRYSALVPKLKVAAADSNVCTRGPSNSTRGPPRMASRFGTSSLASASDALPGRFSIAATRRAAALAGSGMPMKSASSAHTAATSLGFCEANRSASKSLTWLGHLVASPAHSTKCLNGSRNHRKSRLTTPSIKSAKVRPLPRMGKSTAMTFMASHVSDIAYRGSETRTATFGALPSRTSSSVGGHPKGTSLGSACVLNSRRPGQLARNSEYCSAPRFEAAASRKCGLSMSPSA
mmetsp:Transcript_91526/g.255608  ORF Transcript_91526/g.255608 Transcript_91526/m.255608 type:complete len:256 (+) Transcript_91526:662-1429(+)